MGPYFPYCGVPLARLRHLRRRDPNQRRRPRGAPRLARTSTTSASSAASSSPRDIYWGMCRIRPIPACSVATAGWRRATRWTTWESRTMMMAALIGSLRERTHRSGCQRMLERSRLGVWSSLCIRLHGQLGVDLIPYHASCRDVLLVVNKVLH